MNSAWKRKIFLSKNDREASEGEGWGKWKRVYVGNAGYLSLSGVRHPTRTGKWNRTRVYQAKERFSSVQSLSHVWLFATPWIPARQASLSITNSRSPPKPMSIESVMPSNHPILSRPLLLLLSIFPGIRVFSNESALHIRYGYIKLSLTL